MIEQRPTIILYTDAAEICDEVRTAMITAGYLPIRVSDEGSIRMLPTPVFVDQVNIPLITKAALSALLHSEKATLAHTANFGASVARFMLEEGGKK